MYYINKIVGWVMSPMGLLFMGIACGAILKGVGRKGVGSRWLVVGGRWVIGLTLGVFWILGCGITTRVIGVGLEGEEIEGVGSRVEGVEAIVVLGGGVGIHEKCGRVELFGGADRVWTGVRLHKAYGVPIVLGGGMNEKIKPLMSDFGVPREAWSFVEDARNTEEEAKLIAERLAGSRDEGVGSKKLKICLVTSAWHMPRAKMLFERAGFEIVEGPCDYEMHYATERPIEFGDFFPSADAMAKNGWAVKEWVARAGYRLLRR